MSIPFLNSDREYFWKHYMGGLKGNVPKPEYAYVPPGEKWGPGSPWYLLRERFGRHRCPACGKPHFSYDAAWNCHSAASACILWDRFAHTGPAGARSLEDTIRTELSNPYGPLGSYYGGSYGL